MNPALIEVPGTRYVVLKDDACLGKWAMESGSIIGEKYIADLPEVQALEPGAVVLDCGGFIGDTGVIFQGHGCDVWIFEPYRDAYDAAVINCPGAHVLNVAVGDGRPMAATGEKCERGNNLGTRMVKEGGHPTLRIDDLNFPQVDAVKIDVEGGEPMVLYGMRRTIERCKPWLLIELYDGPLQSQGFSRRDVLDFLQTVGYSWRTAIGNFGDERCDILAVPL